MSNNPDSHELLAVIASVHHQRICEALDDRALRLSETFAGISTGRMRYVDGRSDLNVVTGE